MCGCQGVNNLFAIMYIIYNNALKSRMLSFLFRYHKLVWGPHGIDDQGQPSGVLIAGGETGNIILYDPSKIIAGDSEVVIAQIDKHAGPVRALDVNPFQVMTPDDTMCLALHCRVICWSEYENYIVFLLFCLFSLKTNLVASGGNESEIYIWDLNSFSTPMTPGPKSQVHTLYSHFMCLIIMSNSVEQNNKP